MKTERVIFSFIAVLIGLLFAGVLLLVYQSTKTAPPIKTAQVPQKQLPTVTPQTSVENSKGLFISLDQPADESVVTQRTITIKGKTADNATIFITTPNANQTATAASNGTFSTSVTLDTGVNPITIIAIAANGEEVRKFITVTSTTDEF